MEGDLMSRLQQQRKGSERTRKFAFGIGAALCAALLAVSVATLAAHASVLDDAASFLSGVGNSISNALGGSNGVNAVSEGGDTSGGSTNSTTSSSAAVSDAATVTDYESLLGTGKADKPITTANIGRIWTDKSVFTGDASDGVITINKADGADFLTSLSAISSTSNLTSMTNTPLDIVLVLDASGSMDDKISSSSSTTRISALKTAAKAFIDQVAAANAKTSDTNLQHKVSLVKFAGDDTDTVGNTTYYDSKWGANYNNSQTMMHLTTCTSDDATTMKTMIDAITPAGATQADYGMSHAKSELFSDAYGRSDAKKIVVFFTDGTPTSGSDWEDSVASSAVSYANQMKTKGATIYGINILSGSDATSDPTSSSTSNVNKFMHAISSNYPSATFTASSSSSSSGRPGPGGGGSTSTGTWDFGDRSTATDSDGNVINYFKTATSADELSQVFKDIEQQIVNGAGYPTKATDGAADTSGYITIDDELGSYMEVTDLSTLVYNGKIYSNPTKSTTDNVDTYTFEGAVTAGASASNLNKIIITVTRSTDLASGDKVQVKIPASLIPLHHYNIDLTNNKMTGDSTTPVVVCYSSAVKSGAKTLLSNPDDAMKKYMAANTDSDGNVKFYANKWSGTADKGDTVATFEPSDGNLYYYYTSDTALYTDEKFTTQATSIDENATYYYKHSYYTMDSAVVDETAGTASGTPTATTEAIALPGSTAKTYQDAGNIGTDSDTKGLFVKDGTPRLNFINTLHKAKTDNTTATASDVLNPVWASADTLAAYSTINSHLGNNGITSYYGNLNISVTNSGGNAGDEFEVTVELKDASGNPISGTFGDVVFDKAGKSTITLKDGESKSIPNVPAGATYTVTQKSKEGYQTSYTVNDGSSSTTPATGTIASNGTQNVTVKNEFSAKIATVQRDGKTVYVNDQLVSAGEEITYTIGWANTTNNAGVKVTVTDKLPDGLEFVSAENGGTYDKDTNTVTWVFEKQAGDAAGTVTLKAKVSEADFGGNSITNSATVKIEDVLGYTTWYNPKSSTVNVLRKQVQDKSIFDNTGKDINGEAISINDELIYKITFTVGEDVDSAVLTDKLPEGTKIVRGDGNYNSTTNTVKWEFKNLKAGTQYVAWLGVAVKADSVATIDAYINQAQLELNGSGTKLNTNKVSNTVAKGDLDVKLVTDPANTNDTFDVTVKANDRNDYAIIGTFGEGENKIVFNEKGEATFTMKGGETKTLKDLPAGATYTVTQTSKDGYSTTYTVNGGDSSPTPATGEIDSTDKQTVVITDKLGKTATVQRDGQQVDAGGQLVGVGDVITYNINWLNDAKGDDGKLTSAAVTVTDALPAGTELVEGSISGSGTYADGTITWSLGDQAAGASGTVSFSVKVVDASNDADDDADGIIANTANIVVGNQPKVTNTSKVNVPTKFATRYPVTPEGTGTATTAKTATVGDTLAYNVSFVVPADATSATVTDVVPAGTEYVAESAKCNNEGIACEASCENGIVTWKLSNLESGKTVTVTFQVKILASVDIATGVDNAAKVKPSNGPEVSTNTVHTSIAKPVIVKGDTDLKFAKILAGRDWTADDKFTFTIEAVTEGAPMPENSTVEVTSKTAKSNDKVEFNFGDIKFATPGTYEYTVTETGNTATDVLSDQVPAKVTIVVTEDEGKLSAKTSIENGTFDNVAVVKTATFANTTANTDEPSVTADADDEEATEVKVGDVLQYTIPYSNTTGAQATIVVTDTLAEGLTLDKTTLDSSASYDEGTRTITWTIKADKTESGTVGFRATVNSAAVKTIATDGTASLSNTAKVSVKDNPKVTATSKPFTSTVKTGEVDVSVVNKGGDPAKEFDVTVTVTDKGGNPVTGTFGGTTLDKDGKATITMIGGDTQKLTGLPEGATVTVTQTGEDGYTTTYKVNAGDPTTDPAKATVDPATPQKVVITNTAIKKVDYSANGGVAVSKTVNGHAMSAGQFAYTVKPDAAAAKKLGLDSSANAYKVTAADDGKASVIDLFGGKNVVFGPEDAGTYTFTIDETTAPDGSGYTNDSAQRTVTITVSVDPTTREVTVVTTATKAGEGKPFATSTVTSADKAGTVNKVVVPFVSTYEATGTLGGDGDGAVAIQASKTLTGRDMAAGEFNFVATDAKGTQVATGTNAAATSGTAAVVTFSKIDYSVASLKEAVAAGTATLTADGAYKLQYNVAESTELPAGVTAGAKSFAITVTVTDNGDGTLTPKVTYPEGTESLVFTNSYSSESAPVTFAGTKVLSLADASLTRELKAGEFSFAVTATDGGKLPESTTATNDAAGNVKFGTVTYTQDDLAGVTADKDGIRTKTFTYQVSESGSVDGVTNDASAHKFTVTLTEDTAKATLTATVKAEEGTAATAGAFSFTNVYGVSDSSSSITDDTVEGQQPIKVNKTLTGRAMTAGEFKFELVDKGGTTVATGTNQADGTVTFGAVKYSKPGTYTYELREAEGELGGVTYDSTTYTVVTTVTDLGTGKLKVEHALYSAAGKEITDGVAKFANSYEPAATVAKINASKVLTGATLAKDQFTFAVTDADGNVVGTVTNDENGKISFSGLVFTADDMVDESGARVMTKTFTYYLSEVNDEQANVTYDGTVYTITVTVTDDGEGNLTAVVAYENVDDAPVFNNTYTEPAKAQAAASNNKTSSAKTGDGALQTILMLIGVAMAAAAATAAVSVRRKRNGMSE